MLPITNGVQQRRKTQDPEWTAPTTHENEDDDDDDDHYDENAPVGMKDDFSYKTFKKDMSEGYNSVKDFVSSLWPTNNP